MKTYPFGIISLFNVVLLFLLLRKIVLKCYLDWHVWCSASSYGISYALLAGLILAPFLYQLIFRNKLGWSAILLLLACLLIGSEINDYVSTAYEIKFGVTEEVWKSWFYYSLMQVIIALIIWAVISFPRENKYTLRSLKDRLSLFS